MRKIVPLLLVLAFSTAAAAQGGPSVSFESQLIKSEPVPLQNSEYGTVWVEFRNTGDVAADDVTVEFNERYPFTAGPETRTEWNLGEFRPGEEYQLRLQVKVDENAVSGTNNLSYSISRSGSSTVLREEVPVEVRTDDATVSFEEVSVPEFVPPGASGDVNVTLENLADSQLKNIDISIDLQDVENFAPRGTATDRIQTMEPGERVNVSFEVIADENADNGLQTVPLTVEFQNEAGTEFSQETSTGIVIGGEPDLDLALDSRQSSSSGTIVTLRLTNQGYGRAQFVSVNLQESDEFEILSEDSVYIGEMESDDFQTAQFTVRTSSEEAVSLPAEVQYRSLDGKQVTRTAEVEFRPVQSSGGGPGSNMLLIGGAAFVALLIGLWYWRRRRKRRME
jgi:hypothetical protein